MTTGFSASECDSIENTEVFKKLCFKISGLLNEGREKEAGNLISLLDNEDHLASRILFTFSDSFKDEQILFDLIIDVYTIDGYHFPKRIIQTAKRIAKNIPEEHRLNGLPNHEMITVWRGTDEINNLHGANQKASISWTTNKDTAIWFANRYGNGCVWEGKIPRKKIIAFTNCRNESEVIQHMNVQNPHIVKISSEELNQALKRERSNHHEG